MAIDPSLLAKAAGSAGGSGGSFGSTIGQLLPSATGLLGIGSQIWANNQNKRMTYELNKRQFDQAVWAAQWERMWANKDWKREAYYNHPAQQMKRLQEAGLNPHLVYGNGADATMGSVRSTNVSLPHQSAPQVQPIDFSGFNPLASIYDLQARGTQSDNLQVMSQIYRAQADNLMIDGLVKSQELKDKTLQYEIQTEIKDEIVAERQLRNQNLEQQIESAKFYRELATSKFSLDKLRTEFDRQRLNLMKAKTQADIDMITSSILRNEFQNAQTKASTKQIEQAVRNLMQSQRITAIQATLLQRGLTPGTPEYIKRYTDILLPTIGTLIQLGK